MDSFLKLFLATQLCLVSCLDPSTVVLAIDCGYLNKYSSTFGFDYYPHTEYASSPTYTESTAQSVGRTKNPTVYQAARSSSEATWWYQFPISENGNYVLILQFAEITYTEANKRNFRIGLGTSYIYQEDFDIYLNAGALNAYDIFIEFFVDSGIAYYNSIEITNSGDDFRFFFSNKGLGDPTISGIILISGDCNVADRCNMCYDKGCIDCDVSTLTCNTCIATMTPVNGICQCSSSNTYYEYAWYTCVICDNLCEVCVGTEKLLCQSCYSFYYLVSDICLRSCPYGFSTGCIETTSLLINAHFDGNFAGTYSGIFKTGESDSSYYFFNTPESNDPIPAKSRGLYFSGGSYIKSIFDIYFSVNFSIGLWMWLENSSSGGIMTHGKDYKLSVYSSGIIYIILENESENTSAMMTNELSRDIQSWLYFSITIFYSSQSTTANLYLNNVLELTSSIAGYIYRDATTDNAIILGTRGGSGFTGFLYAFHFWNTALSDFTEAYFDDLCGTGNIATCLWSCSFQEWIDNGVSTFCDTACYMGCTRNGSCNICDDPLCDKCTGFENGLCSQCVAHASGSPCSCESPYITSESGFECISCSSGCESCTGVNPYDCLSCNTGYFKLETWCLLDNPNNYALDSCIVSYEFTKITNVQYDSVNSYPIYMGSSDIYFTSYDTNDPWILPYRGLYFKGNSFASLPQRDDIQNGISLGLSHTIDIWAMVLLDNTNGVIYSVYTDYSYVIMISAVKYDSSSYNYQVWYNLTNIDGQSTTANSLTSPNYSFNIWQRVIVSYSYQTRSILRIFINDQMVSSQELSDYFYYEYYHKAELGNWKTSNGFVGYIYSLKMYNYAMESVASWSATSCGYPFCTENNDALISCNPREFYDISSKSCNYCSSYCLYGCARKDDTCNLHQNPLCESYDNLKFNNCEICKEHANNIPPCTCSDYLVYDAVSESCKCSDGSQIVGNQCYSTCFRYLQSNEINGYFTSTFLKIIFEFSIAIDTTGLRCENLFPASTIAKFGSGYTCSLDSKQIIIELGKNFAVRNEVLSLIKGSLKGSKACGYSSNDLNVALYYSAPTLHPLSIIDGPNTVLYNCQDLFISGQKSSGNANSALEYKWTLSSDPPLSSLLQFNTDFQTQTSYLSIPRSDLPTASITVTLTVRNIFGNVDTNSIVIECIPNGISVNFDTAISNQIMMAQSYFYSVGSISSCDKTGELSLDWKLISAIGNLTAIDEKFIWDSQKSQSSLYIPAKSIPLYTNATFALHVNSISLNTYGVGTVKVFVFPVSPIIQFSRADGNADATKELSIDASSSYDPNENKTLSFSWNCVKNNSIDCSSLISNPYSSILNIPSNSLETGIEYEFILTVRADFSNGRQGTYFAKAEKSIKINTVNYYAPDLNIINAISYMQSGAISGDKRFPIAARVKEELKYQLSYQWSLSGEQSLEFATPLDQYAIAISQDSLNSGITYTLTLAIFDGDHYSSFFYSFYVNSPPSSGTLFVVPGEGLESETMFKMDALGWIDEENDYPFTYSFGYLTDNNYAFMNIKNQSSTYFTTFPYLGRSVLSAFVDAYDSLEAFSRKIVNIKISKNKDLDQNELYNSSKDYIDSITSNPKAYPGIISGLCNSILNRDYYLSGEFKEPSDDDMAFLQEVLSSALEWTKNVIENENLENQSVSILANLLKMISFNPYLLSGDASTKIFKMINTITENIPESQILLNEQIDSYFTTIEQSYQYNATSLVNKTNNLEFTVDTVNNLSRHILSQMVINEKHFTVTGNLDVTLSVMKVKDLDNFKIFSNSKSASVTLPSNFSLILGNFTSETEVGISLTLLKSPNNADSLSSSVVDFSMYDLHTKKKLEINMTSSYILLEIPTWNYRSSKFVPVCAFLDTKYMNWSTEGCLKAQIETGNITCSCNHFTSFAAIDSAGSTLVNSNIGDTVNVSAWTSLNESNAIGLYFGIATLIIYIILAVFTYKKDKKEEKLENEVRKKLKGIPIKLEKVIDKFDDISTVEETDKQMENSQLVKKGKSSICCCKKKKKCKENDIKSDTKELHKSSCEADKIGHQVKTSDGSEFNEENQEIIKPVETKKSFLKCCKKKPKNKSGIDQSEAFVSPEEVYVYSFTDGIASTNSIDPETEEIEESRMKKWLHFFSEKHELFNILYTRVPEHPSLCRVTLYFLVLIGQMFFIGMFYEASTSTSSETIATNSTNSTSSTYSDYSSEGFEINYTWQDFWIMAWSSLLMIIITTVLSKLFTEQATTEHMTEIQYLKIKRKNKIKRWIGIFLAWGIMFYFLWSIALYAIQFDQDISRIWVANTGISYTVNILFTSVVKAAITAYVTIKLLELIEKFKKKKIKENNEAEIKFEDFQSPTSEVKTNEVKN